MAITGDLKITGELKRCVPLATQPTPHWLTRQVRHHWAASSNRSAPVARISPGAALRAVPGPAAPGAGGQEAGRGGAAGGAARAGCGGGAGLGLGLPPSWRGAEPRRSEQSPPQVGQRRRHRPAGAGGKPRGSPPGGRGEPAAPEGLPRLGGRGGVGGRQGGMGMGMGMGCEAAAPAAVRAGGRQPSRGAEIMKCRAFFLTGSCERNVSLVWCLWACWRGDFSACGQVVLA